MIHYLSDLAIEAGFSLDNTQLTQFDNYKNLLVEWNEKMNLTAITEEQEVATKHFIDSLYGLKFLKNAKTLIDVGTGAGFPGLPLKIAYPSVSLTLLDSLNKRLNFLNTVVDELRLSDVTTVHSRAEDGASVGTSLRESFDVAVSRAVARFSVLAEYCLPYVKCGGVFLAYKGGDVEDELAESQNAIETLGGEVNGIFKYTIPKTDITHSIVVIKKIKQTPDKYPRQGGKIQKKPL